MYFWCFSCKDHCFIKDVQIKIPGDTLFLETLRFDFHRMKSQHQNSSPLDSDSATRSPNFEEFWHQFLKCILASDFVGGSSHLILKNSMYNEILFGVLKVKRTNSWQFFFWMSHRDICWKPVCIWLETCEFQQKIKQRRQAHLGVVFVGGWGGMASCLIWGFFVRKQHSKEKQGTYVHRCFFQTWMNCFS